MPQPRKLYLGAFQPHLEAALADEITAYKKTRGPLAPLTVVVPTRLLGLHLQRTLVPHANLRFTTLDDLLQMPAAPRFGLELLCRRLAKSCEDYFAPVNDTPGFATALLETFKDLEQAGISRFTGKTKKLRELARAYTTYRQWLDDHDFRQSAVSNLQSPVFLYGFYDLTMIQKDFVERLNPAAIFFPRVEHAEFSQPLLDWFQSRPVASSRPQPVPSTIISCPGEPAEVREAFRAVLRYVAETGKTFNDCAILCRSREQYDAIIRDTAGALGLPIYFRGGRPLTEHPDAKLLWLLLEVIRSNYSRATMMELACHIGPHSPWDARTVELGIVAGQSQWQRRLRPPDRELSEFITKIFTLAEAIPAKGQWTKFIEPVLAAFRALGGSHLGVSEAISALAELDAFESPVTFETFAEFCQKAIEAEREPTGKFQGGGIFVGDVMSARGLSFPFVMVLGLVEKSFPRVIREDPLLLDDERRQISPDLPLKQRGYDEEHLLFDLARATAREQLVLSYPRIEPATARPRVPSFLLLEHTGAKDFKALDKLVLKTTGEPPLDEGELDLKALQVVNDDYLAEISLTLRTGVQAYRQRWGERALTRYDGMIDGTDARQLLRERFGLEKLVISATSLEDFFGCPFYYFQKHVLGIERWEEPEATVVIESKDLGSLYHAILEDYYRGGELVAVTEKHFERFEREGVTGYPAVWAIKKEIILDELAAFVARDRGKDWRPVEFEKKFDGLAVAAPVRLRGTIDRIDLSADRRRARVLDYKTGKLPRGLRDDALAGGEALQLPLYLLAAEKLLPDVSVEAASYLFFTLRGGYRDIHFSRGALEARRDDVNKLLDTAAGMIRDGVFAQHATPENCRQCDFRPICGNGILKLAARKLGDARITTFHEIKETVK